MARRKRRQPAEKDYKGREDLDSVEEEAGEDPAEEVMAERDPGKTGDGDGNPAKAVSSAADYADTEGGETERGNIESAGTESSNTESSETERIIKKSSNTERTNMESSSTVKEENPTSAGMMTDAMPEFLRSANSTIRRDGPYKNYSGNADVLRHKKRENEKQRGSRVRKKKQKIQREGMISTETISLVALVIILGTIIFSAVRHVEMRELSLAVLLITAVITIIMGVLLGDAPSYVTLILVALIIIAGAITGMFSEVITGAVFFLGTVLAIKGRFE
ncbi:MAG: DMT family transporter [Lachnospiraceae bacterium]|nr:DMT family transporter [Lachnospiraceae bacterium]